DRAAARVPLISPISYILYWLYMIDYQRVKPRPSAANHATVPPPRPGSGFMVRTSRRHFLGGAAAIGFPGDALAQTRPIRMLVGFAAGGGNDVIARLVAQKMGEGASGQVLVDNKTGASGLIAADILAKAPPDGTTLMVAAQTTYAVAPQLYKSV